MFYYVDRVLRGLVSPSGFRGVGVGWVGRWGTGCSGVGPGGGWFCLGGGVFASGASMGLGLGGHGRLGGEVTALFVLGIFSRLFGFFGLGSRIFFP